MAGAKEIRSKISSIKNTQKITKAMEMVAASKMRKAQERMRAARPYAREDPQRHRPPAPGESGLQASRSCVERAGQGGRHHRRQHRPRPRRRRSTSTCSRRRCRRSREWQGKGAKVQLCLIGTKALQFFRRLRLPISRVTSRTLGDRPHVKDLIGTVKVMLDAYASGKIDRLFLVQQRVREHHEPEGARSSQLLPVEAVGHAASCRSAGTTSTSPTPAELLDGILMRYIESQVYQGAVENVACEMAARMVAMKSATDNAGKLIGELQLIYNKARQAAITKELSEIVGGAAAV